MRIAALVKQIPKFEAMTLGPDGRLQREGLELEMNPYCRRAVSQAVELAARHGGAVTVLTLGPPAAEDTLREAIAWGLDRRVTVDGVLVTDPAFAGSDTLATARALAAALQREGPFDLVLVGRNSVDADTGQVGPEIAELLDLPFATGVRHLSIADRVASVRCEHDDGWLVAEVPLPAVLSAAERLCEPCKVEPEGRAAVPAERIRVLAAADLGAGPWGQEASPTWVGPVRTLDIERARLVEADAPIEEQVQRAVELLVDRGALDAALDHAADVGRVPGASASSSGPAVAVIVEPARDELTRELLGAAATMAGTIGGHVVALVTVRPSAALGSWGADRAVHLAADVPLPEEDVAGAVAAWADAVTPWALLAPSTAWGREVASRVAARIGAGLTGDAVALEIDGGSRLVAWKPAFGGRLVAAITATSVIQLATVRAGMLPRLEPREATVPALETVAVVPRGRIRLLARDRDDDLDVLAEAAVVVGVGRGVAPDEYVTLDPLLDVLGAELGATRKVTDEGWLPRARQIGITGRSIAPRLYVALAVGGKFNHSVGIRAARTVLAINADPAAPIFDHADVGVVGDWRAAVPLLVEELRSARVRTTQ